MANEEHLQILKQGVDYWNQWRKDTYAKSGYGRDVHLTGARLSRANLRRVDFGSVDLSGADLSHANLSGADLTCAILRRAILMEANLEGAVLEGAVLTGANLSATHLSGANLRAALLTGADLTNSKMGNTILADIDLSQVRGLETVQHLFYTTIGIDTVILSQGKIPEVFLRGAGVPDVFITNMRSLVSAMSPIEFYSCFISFSSREQEFATRLHGDLQSKGVRCWFAPEDLKIGDPFRKRIDDAIRVHDKLLIVLSSNSVSSFWVEKEVETAFEKERLQNRTVLFPIRLDDAVMETKQAWAADIRRTRHIGDFCHWKD
ncbi:MAG TPA: toll/interleukin-1 receptor domain-containing protein, partial [Candidatus Angelobacter sp.]